MSKEKWLTTLSTTEPYNHIGLIQVRQSNKNSETWFIPITQNGEEFNFDDEGITQVFFCTKFGKYNPVEQRAEIIDAKKGYIKYVMNDYDMQQTGIRHAYFKFEDDGGNYRGSTQTFSYYVISSLEKTCADSETYIVRLEELFKLYQDYQNQEKDDWEKFVKANRKILEDIDPGGKILTEMIDFRHSKMLNKTFDRIKDRGDFWDEELEERALSAKWLGIIPSTDNSQDINSLFKNIEPRITEVYFTKGTYHVSELNLKELSNVLIDFRGSTLKLAKGNFKYLMELNQLKNVEIKNFIIDCDNRAYRALKIGSDNYDLKVHSFKIKNVSPEKAEIDIDSIAIDFDISGNHNIQFSNFEIKNVHNYNNGVIGDGLGSSRGILLKYLDISSNHSRIRFKNFEIDGIHSEDADAIVTQCSDQKINVQFDNFDIIDADTRAIKQQATTGCVFKNYRVSQSNSLVPMKSGISDYFGGNRHDNFEINIKSIKGIEYAPRVINLRESIFKDFSIILNNTEKINNQRVYCVDILPIDLVEKADAIKVTFEDFELLGPNNQMIVRNYTKSLKIKNGKMSSYTKDKVAIFLSFSAPYKNSDGTEYSHTNIIIDGLETDVQPLYADNNTTFTKGYIKNITSNDGKDPYSFLNFRTEKIEIAPQTYRMQSLPSKGYFGKGSIVYNTNFTNYPNVGWICIESGTPGVWKEFGKYM